MQPSAHRTSYVLRLLPRLGGAVESPGGLWDLLGLDDRSGSAWRAEALCAQVDGDLFFPEKGESSVAAKRVCAECSVQSECLAEALARNERFGVWGGLSERERQAVRVG